MLTVVLFLFFLQKECVGSAVFSSDNYFDTSQIDHLLCPPPFPDLLQIFEPSLRLNPTLANLTDRLVAQALKEDCGVFAPLFNGHLSKFNEHLCSIGQSSPLKTDELIDEAVASTCPYSQGFEPKKSEFDGDWKKKRDKTGFRYSSKESHKTPHKPIEFKGIERQYEENYMGGMYNEKPMLNPTKDYIVSDIQKLGSIILVVVFISVLLSVAVVVAVLAWLRKNATRSYSDVQQKEENKSAGNHWYDGADKKEGIYAEQRSHKQYL